MVTEYIVKGSTTYIHTYQEIRMVQDLCYPCFVLGVGYIYIHYIHFLTLPQGDVEVLKTFTPQKRINWSIYCMS